MSSSSDLNSEVVPTTTSPSATGSSTVDGAGLPTTTTDATASHPATSSDGSHADANRRNTVFAQF